MPLDKTDVIDLVAVNAAGDEVALILVATEPWDDVEKTLRVQAKLKSYVAFAADGQLVRTYPDLAGRKVRIKVRTDHPLGEREAKLVEAVREHWCKREGISLVTPSGPAA